MRLKYGMLFAAVMLTAAFAALDVEAREPVYGQQYDQCLRASNGNTFAMIDCTSTELVIWDKALNASYRDLMATLTPMQQKALTAAQVLWIKYRDANCAFVADPSGGQMARLGGTSCLLRMTSERAVELKDFKQ